MFVTFLRIGTMLPFIYLIRNTLVFKQSLKISAKGLLIQSANTVTFLAYENSFYHDCEFCLAEVVETCSVK